MNLFTVFQFIFLGINLILCIYIISKHLNNKIGYAYLYIATSITIWALGDTLEMTAINPDTSYLWSRIGAIGAIFVGVFFIRFVLTIISPEKIKSFLIQSILIIPALILSFISFFTPLFTTGVIKMPWGYIDNNTSNFIFLALFVSGLIALAIIIALSSLHKQNDLQRKQMWLFIIAYLFPLIVGVVTQIILPLFHLLIPSLITISAGISAIIIFYAISKYNFLSISPALALNQIFNTISDILIAINGKCQIVLVNNAVEKMLGFSVAELTNKNISMILKNQDGSEIKDETFFNSSWKNVRMQAVSKNDSKPILVLINGSFVILSGKKQGLVLVMHDMTEVNKLVIDLNNKNDELEFSKQELAKNLDIIKNNLEETKKLNGFMTDRELKMIELKQKISDLEKSSNSK